MLSTVCNTLSHLMMGIALKVHIIIIIIIFTLLTKETYSKSILPWVAKIIQIFLYVTLITAHWFFQYTFIKEFKPKWKWFYLFLENRNWWRQEWIRSGWSQQEIKYNSRLCIWSFTEYYWMPSGCAAHCSGYVNGWGELKIDSRYEPFPQRAKYRIVRTSRFQQEQHRANVLSCERRTEDMPRETSLCSWTHRGTSEKGAALKDGHSGLEMVGAEGQRGTAPVERRAEANIRWNKTASPPETLPRDREFVQCVATIFSCAYLPSPCCCSCSSLSSCFSLMCRFKGKKRSPPLILHVLVGLSFLPSP